MRDREFKDTILNYYDKNKRNLPWRDTTDPYKVLVSETMLQQTQVSRVLIKYEEFIKKYPSLEKLAAASQQNVLKDWQGLGYNRRALNLKKTASLIKTEYNGIFPKTYEQLTSLPGIGQSTAGAILNFCFNVPTPFIETNIRAVYLNYYFKDSSEVSDKDILPIIKRTIDADNPRDWFFALYDYGTHLKNTLGKKKTDLHLKSKHYTKQRPFKGSNREIRSNLLKLFISSKTSFLSLAKIEQLFEVPSEILKKNLMDLSKEGFLDFLPKKSLWRLKP